MHLNIDHRYYGESEDVFQSRGHFILFDRRFSRRVFFILPVSDWHVQAVTARRVLEDITLLWVWSSSGDPRESTFKADLHIL
jgi:hypothetical protein